MNSKNLKIFVLVILGYILFTIFLTYPIALRINSLAGPNGDNLMFAWNMWWAKRAVMELRTDPFQTDYIFYPNNICLTYHTFCPFNSFISIPLQYVFNLAVTYNLILLSTFLFSGLGAYLLVYYFTKNRLASFIGGLIFAFCPYHFAHAECHLNHATMQFIPFSILYLVKLYDYKKVRYALLSGIFLALNFYSCYYYGVYLAIFISVFLVYWCFRGDKEIINKKFFGNFLFIVFIFLILTSPLLYRFVKEGWGRDSFYAGGQEGYVSDLIGLFTPSILHTFFRYFQWLNSICSRFTGCPPEYTVFLGYTVLLLSLIAIFKIRSNWKWFWGFSSLFFIILSFGPHLHILGKTYFGNISLPYYWIVQIVPFFKQARCPSRFIVMTMLSLSVLAGYGFTYIFGKLKKPEGKLIMFTIICLLISFEFSTIPVRQTPLKIPKFYYEIKKDKKDYAILDFPIFMCDSSNELYMYLQTIHEKKIVNGWISRLPQNLGAVLNDVAKLSKSSLRRYNIKYIVIHKDLIEGARNLDDLYKINLLKGDVQKHIFDLLESEKRFEKLPIGDQDIVVYKVPPEIENEEGPELLYIFDKKGGEFDIQEDGDYLIRVKVSVEPYLNRIKEDGLVLEFNSPADLEKLKINPSNSTYQYSIWETGGLFLSTYFDGSSWEDEYVQMRLKGINVDLKRYPYFYLTYKVEDPKIQTIEVVVGVDFNSDNIVDEYIRGLYPMPASSDFSRYTVNLYDRIKDKIPMGGDCKAIALELYPHKIWGADCTLLGDRGMYNFWINKIGFYNYSLSRGREVITGVRYISDLIDKRGWQVGYHPKAYEFIKKRGSIVILQSYPCIELSKYVDYIDLQRYNILELNYVIDESIRLNSIEPLLGVDLNGDKSTDIEVPLGELSVSKGCNRQTINVLEKVIDNFPNLDKCFLTNIKLRLRIDKGMGYQEDLFRLNSIKFYSKRFRPDSSFIFREPVFELDGNVCWINKRFSQLEDAKSVLFSKIVFLKKGKHNIGNLLGDGLDYIAIEKVVNDEEYRI